MDLTLSECNLGDVCGKREADEILSSHPVKRQKISYGCGKQKPDESLSSRPVKRQKISYAIIENFDPMKELVKSYVEENCPNQVIQESIVELLSSAIASNLRDILDEAYHLRKDRLLKMEHFKAAIKNLDFDCRYFTSPQTLAVEKVKPLNLINFDSRIGDTVISNEASDDLKTQSQSVLPHLKTGCDKASKMNNLEKLKELILNLNSDNSTKALISTFHKFCRENYSDEMFQEILIKMDGLLSRTERLEDNIINELLSLLLHCLHYILPSLVNRTTFDKLTKVLVKFVEISSYKTQIYKRALPLYTYYIKKNPQLNCLFCSHIVKSIQSPKPFILIFPKIRELLDNALQSLQFTGTTDLCTLNEGWIVKTDALDLYFQLLHLCETIINGIMYDTYKFQYDFKETKSFIDYCFEYFGESLTARLGASFRKYVESGGRQNKFLRFINLPIHWSTASSSEDRAERKKARKAELEAIMPTSDVAERKKSRKADLKAVMPVTVDLEAMPVTVDLEEMPVTLDLEAIMPISDVTVDRGPLPEKTQGIPEKLMNLPPKNIRRFREQPAHWKKKASQAEIDAIMSISDVMVDIGPLADKTQEIPEKLLMDLRRRNICLFQARPAHWKSPGDLRTFI